MRKAQRAHECVLHDVVGNVAVSSHCPRMAPQCWELCLDHLREIHTCRLHTHSREQTLDERTCCTMSFATCSFQIIKDLVCDTKVRVVRSPVDRILKRPRETDGPKADMGLAHCKCPLRGQGGRSFDITPTGRSPLLGDDMVGGWLHQGQLVVAAL